MFRLHLEKWQTFIRLNPSNKSRCSNTSLPTLLSHNCNMLELSLFTHLSIPVLHVQLQQVDLMGITIKSLAEIEKEVSRHKTLLHFS